MSERKLFTSESVSEGHPDKIADQISDAILDAILEQDPDAHVAAETAVYTGSVHVFGEISTTAYVDINRVVRDTIADIGYTDANYGFAADSVGVHPYQTVPSRHPSPYPYLLEPYTQKSLSIPHLSFALLQ